MKLRLLRDGDALAGGTLLVRGGELDPDVIRADARRYHDMYGTYGISVFAVRLEPTGRNPRHYTGGFEDLILGMKALTGCQRQVVTDSYRCPGQQRKTGTSSVVPWPDLGRRLPG
jgi:hypothetical protein